MITTQSNEKLLAKRERLCKLWSSPSQMEGNDFLLFITEGHCDLFWYDASTINTTNFHAVISRCFDSKPISMDTSQETKRTALDGVIVPVFSTFVAVQFRLAV